MTQSEIGIALTWLEHGLGLDPPRFATQGAAGADLSAALGQDEELVLAPGAIAAVPCGFALALPAGYEAQVRPRSGLALKHGVTVLNAPGTIDSDYRGEVKVILINHGSEPMHFKRGDRVAQMVIGPVTRAAFEVVTTLTGTARGTGGFGSTGHDAL